MPLYTLTNASISPVPETSFGAAGLLEREDLQRLLLDNISIVSPETLIIAEEFSWWDASYRRIDLLGIDKRGNLIVIELKRDDTGAHMELQAIRYAAMIARMTFDQAVTVYQGFLASRSAPGDARELLLQFLEQEEPDLSTFAQDVRIVLVSADFSRELTTSVMWLNEREVDITCVQLKPYQLNGQLLVNVEQVIPLPEASEYQDQVRERARQERAATTPDPRYDLQVNGHRYSRLYKRGLIYRTIRSAIEILHKTPQEIAAVAKHSRLWASAPGDLNSDAFRAAVEAQGLNPRRFFTADDELFHYDGSTMALTNQWGTNTVSVMEALRAAFPELHISYGESPNA